MNGIIHFALITMTKIL